MNDKILSAFLGSGISLAIAFFVWLLKSDYEKHKEQKLSIIKVERAFVHNLATLSDIKSLLIKWVEKIKNRCRYSCKFGNLVIKEDEVIPINDKKLINRIIKCNFLFHGINEDINNIYSDYKDMNKYLLDKKITEEEFIKFSDYLMPQIEVLPKAIGRVEDSVIETLAYIRLFGKNRTKFSLFGWIDKLNIDLIVRITEKRINKEILKIKGTENEK